MIPTSRKRLLIISDTPMWREREEIKVFEATLREIEQLSDDFASITWMGFLWPGKAKGNARSDKTGKIRFVPLKAEGGESLIKKAGIVYRLPQYFFRILAELKNADVVHTRAPSMPALIGILLSMIDNKRIYWHKYAGNWMQPNMSWIYKLQKKLLLHARDSRVTINGQFAGQGDHILAFANPCLTDDELMEATVARLEKKYEGPLNIVFAGRIETAKGIDKLLGAIKLIEAEAEIAGVYLAGDGPVRAQWEKYASGLKVPVHFLGFLGRNELNEIYSIGHIFCLPSATEGFPKVVAEAASFGCVPIVSDVSAISQIVINGERGLILKNNTTEDLAKALLTLFNDRVLLKKLSAGCGEMATEFTYTKYRERIKSEIVRD